MRRIAAVSMIALSLSGCSIFAPRRAAAPPPTPPVTEALVIPVPAPPPAPAPLAELVKAVDIPFETFKLANGLTVIVHTDRKAPIVGVTTYYRVGSKHEPRGRTGFAHLFEHLMFGGSENVPNFDIPLEGAGSTSTNGSTWYDRTNYVETVPKGALDLALFMESDRMGHLLGAVTQDKLDKQRGVVQNEKRQGDNQPYGLEDYAVGEGLFPVGHPYRHSTIGSMADLNAASLSDVRKWFTDNYGPNNAVLALTGDIDAATARPLVEKWFGQIPAGPAVAKVTAGPVDLAAPVKRDMADQVPNLRLTRVWSGPGLNDADAAALEVGMDILGGLSSSRLDNALVRGGKQAVSVSASAQQHEQTSMLQVAMMVREGVLRGEAEAALDGVIAKYLGEGPSEDEVRRSATRLVSQEIGQLEVVGDFGGKGMTLAEGQLYSDDPAQYKARLARIAALTPADIKAALNRWLGRPVLAVNTLPGLRTEQGEAMGGWGDEAQRPAPKADAKKPAPKLASGPKRTPPPVAPVGDLAFPGIERARLDNGIPVALVRRIGVPKVMVNLSFASGTAADSGDAPGTQSLMLALLDEGTADKNSVQIAEAQERLGATITAAAGLDASAVTLDALSANLAPSLDLLSEVVRRPAFRAEDVARVRDQRLAEIAQAEANPRALAARAMAPILYGKDHPYGLPSDGLGTAEAVKAMTPDSLRGAHEHWFRADGMKITVVGDATMAQLLPLLNQSFGNWGIKASAYPFVSIDRPVPAPQPRIVLIDRPNSPQSVIMGGRVLPLKGTDQDKEALDLANEVLGNGFLSRLNMDLREDKGWSYGVRSSVSSPIGPRALTVTAPVQADRTGDSIKLIMAQMAAFPGKKPVDPVELARVTDGNVRGLPNRFQTNAQVLGAVVAGQRLGRPDDYIATLASRYRKIDAKAIDAMAGEFLHPQGLVFVVVGDRKLVEPQLKGLGLPVEIASPVDSGGASGK